MWTIRSLVMTFIDIIDKTRKIDTLTESFQPDFRMHAPGKQILWAKQLK